MEAAEREATGIKNLRIQYNRVFGYYIEVTKSNLDQVPLRYARRQTLANAERYTTPELQEIEKKVLNAEQLAAALELQLFTDVRQEITREIGAIQQNALALKTADALLSLAQVARDYGYVKPTINETGEIRIVEGRHPIVERMVQDTPFVPNDVELDTEDNRMLIITGPNMAGKSTYMRQAALITADGADRQLCARAGSRTSACATASSPASGASDDLYFRSVHLHGGDERSWRAFSRSATEQIAGHSGRDRPGHQHFRRSWRLRGRWWSISPDMKEDAARRPCLRPIITNWASWRARFDGVKNYCITVKERGDDDDLPAQDCMPGGADK